MTTRPTPPGRYKGSGLGIGGLLQNLWDSVMGTKDIQTNPALLSFSQMGSIWGKGFQGKNDPKKIKQFIENSKKHYGAAPSHVLDAVDSAVRVLDGDRGVNGQKLKEMLIATAAHESGGYKYRTQRKGGPARGLWQIEPETAFDLLKNSKPLFGPKFKKETGYDPAQLKTLNKKELGDLLKTDDNLAANIAGIKLVTTSADKLR